MNWDQLFSVVNLLALLAWAALILLPWRDRVILLVQLCAVGTLCALYTALVAMALSGGFADGSGEAVSFSSIAGVRAIFADDGGVVAGWVHYLAFDLFIGCWIARDSGRRRIGRIAQAPILLLTFLAGPAGLLLYGVVVLALRRRTVTPRAT